MEQKHLEKKKKRYSTIDKQSSLEGFQHYLKVYSLHHDWQRPLNY